MTLGDIATKARSLTNTDSNTYTDANLLIDLNLWYQKAVTMILESMDEAEFDDQSITATYPIATRSMAARRDYAFSTASWTLLGKEGGSNLASQSLLPLKIRRVDLTYDGTNYYKAEPLDDTEVPYGVGNDSNTDANFIRESPRYGVAFNSLWLYPMPTAMDVTNGGLIRLELDRNITAWTSSDLSTGTVVPGFDAPFHPIVAYGAAWEYAESKQLPQAQALSAQLQDYEARLRIAYGRKQRDRRGSLMPDFIDYN